MRGGELLVVGVEGTRLAPERAAPARATAPGGVVLVQRNIGDRGAARSAGGRARRRPCPRRCSMLDAEGGRVDRLREIVGPAPGGRARWLATVRPSRAAPADGWARRCARFGFDLDLAPVVDLDRGGAGNALDRRYLGASPRRVESRARAFVRRPRTRRRRRLPQALPRPRRRGRGHASRAGRDRAHGGRDWRRTWSRSAGSRARPAR